MIKALAIGLGLALSFGVASAQSKKPPRKRPVQTPAANDKKPAPQPDAAPATATPGGTTPGGTTGTLPGGTTGSTPPPSATGAAPAATSATPATGGTAPAAKGAPMKTDEKAGTQLDRRGTGDYRQVSEANEKKALVAFRDGNAQLNDGFFVKAVEQYRLALTFWDHPAIHYNLALALINLDQPIDVYEQLNKALQYGAEPLEKDKYDHGKEYLRLVEGQLADIEVSCDKIGAKVSVDGKEVFTAPGKYTSKVRVGKHTFYADKEGYNARITAPFVGPGEKYRLELKVYTGPELTRYKRKWQRSWVPYVVMGAGAAIGIVGGVLELSAQSSYDDFNARVEACNMPGQGCSIDSPGILDLRNSGDTKRTLGYVGYGVAGAALATGAIMAWINRRQAYQISPEELEHGQPAIAITPLVSPDGAGAMVQGHF
jgi:hypothetical protein